MSDPFLEWLAEQPYWVARETVNDEWPDAEFKRMRGVTVIPGSHKDDLPDDAVLVPRRDWRMHYIEGTADSAD